MLLNMIKTMQVRGIAYMYILDRCDAISTNAKSKITYNVVAINQTKPAANKEIISLFRLS